MLPVELDCGPGLRTFEAASLVVDEAPVSVISGPFAFVWLMTVPGAELIKVRSLESL